MNKIDHFDGFWQTKTEKNQLVFVITRIYRTLVVKKEVIFDVLKKSIFRDFVKHPKNQLRKNRNFSSKIQSFFAEKKCQKKCASAVEIVKTIKNWPP